MLVTLNLRNQWEKKNRFNKTEIKNKFCSIFKMYDKKDNKDR
jgi:hypothetical protein